MGDSTSGKKIVNTTAEMDSTLSLGISSNSLSRDLLQRFMGNSASGSRFEEVKGDDGDDDVQEIELNLGLSLGGRFGVDKSSNKLLRSSSIASCLPVVRDDNDAVAPPTPVVYSGLMRTSSLPVETEDEWRKRKELQTLRRMEAKRRRSEKQRNSNKERGGSGSGKSLSLEERKEIEVHLREKLDREKYLGSLRRMNSSQFDQGGSDVGLGKGKGSYVGSGGGGGGGIQVSRQQPAPQGSVESKGVGSVESSVSDLESKSVQGSTGELSPTSIQSLQAGGSLNISPSGNRARDSTSSMLGPEKDSTSKKPETLRPKGKEIGTNSLGDMPCVFTKGDGPNGRRVDGILYKYGKGEEVRIMCVCHGSFHSPAEFVKHAGGTDVDHPLKHIVIKPNSSTL